MYILYYNVCWVHQGFYTPVLFTRFTVACICISYIDLIKVFPFNKVIQQIYSVLHIYIYKYSILIYLRLFPFNRPVGQGKVEKEPDIVKCKQGTKKRKEIFHKPSKYEICSCGNPMV